MRLVEGYADVDDLDGFLDDLGEIGETHGCAVQAFDARLVAGERHLERAWACAERAIERGEAIARDPAVEVLCYAAGRRQIDDALAMGVVEGRGPVVVLIAPRPDADDQPHDADGADDEPVDDADGASDEDAAAAAVRDLIEPADLERGVEFGDPECLRDYFDVGDAELGATDADLETLVCERVALLAVER